MVAQQTLDLLVGVQILPGEIGTIRRRRRIPKNRRRTDKNSRCKAEFLYAKPSAFDESFWFREAPSSIG